MRMLTEEEFCNKYLECLKEAVEIARTGKKSWVYITEDYDLAAGYDDKYCKGHSLFHVVLPEEVLAPPELLGFTINGALPPQAYRCYYIPDVICYEYKRMTRGITNARLAEIFGKSKVQVEAYSSGRTPIPEDVLGKALMLDKAITKIQNDDPREQQRPIISRVIGGKLYNTETARLLKMWVQNPLDCNHYECEALYRTKTGHYFVAALGGAQSRFASHGQTGQALQALTLEEAQRWMELHGSAEEYIAFFGMPPEA